MMKHWFLPTANSPATQWLTFLAFLLLMFICLGGVIVWVTVNRAGRGKRKRRKQRHHRPINPTLAETGGLPPRRDPNLPPPGP
jgi:hypothetical protein